MFPRSPFLAVFVCLLLFGCDTSTNPPNLVPKSSSVAIPTIRPGLDTAIDIPPGVASRLLFLPRDSSSYEFAAFGNTAVRIALFDTVGYDPSASRDSLTRSTNRIAWTANSSKAKWLVIAGEDSSTKGAVLLTADIASGTDDHEPDNSRRRASWISTDSAKQTHTIQVGDTDWVKFATSPNKSYSITIASGYNASVRFRIFRDSLSSAATDSGYGVGFVKPAKTSTIFVQIVGSNQQSSGSYTLAIASDSINDKHEPDDTRGGAEWISTDSVPQNRFMQAAEHDWIKFDAVAGRSYRVAMDGDYRVQGFHIYADEQATTPIDSGRESCAFKATKTGTVFVDLHSQNLSGRGKYTVAVSCDSSNDRYEPDDARSNAASIEVGQTQGRHLQAGEHDWFKFVADSGKNYRIAADSCQADIGMDAYLEAGDSILVASGSIMGLKPAKSGTIHVDLSSRNTSGGDYKLSVSVDTTLSDRYEPDDSWRHASEIATDGSVESRSLQLGEHDWIRFHADSGISYLVAAQGMEGAVIRYFVDSVGEYAIGRLMGVGVINAFRTGLIYLDLAGTHGESSGSYSLSVREGDASEPDDTRATATAIATDSTIQIRQISATGHDWIKFEAVQGKSYTISVITPTDVYRQYVVFDVYDDANPWNKATTSGASYTKPTTYTATKDGTVSIDIRGSNVNYTIAYTVSVQAK